MPKKNDFKLDVVSVRLVKDAPIYSEHMRKYYELGYEVEDCPPPAGYKDYNEWLVAAKLNLNQMNQRADEPVRA